MASSHHCAAPWTRCKTPAFGWIIGFTGNCCKKPVNEPSGGRSVSSATCAACPPPTAFWVKLPVVFRLGLSLGPGTQPAAARHRAALGETIYTAQCLAPLCPAWRERLGKPFHPRAADRLIPRRRLLESHPPLAGRRGQARDPWRRAEGRPRVGHTLVLGAIRVGKTRLAEILMTQDIARGDVDRGLRNRCGSFLTTSYALGSMSHRAGRVSFRDGHRAAGFAGADRRPANRR